MRTIHCIDPLYLSFRTIDSMGSPACLRTIDSMGLHLWTLESKVNIQIAFRLYGSFQVVLGPQTSCALIIQYMIPTHPFAPLKSWQGATGSMAYRKTGRVSGDLWSIEVLAVDHGSIEYIVPTGSSMEPVYVLQRIIEPKNSQGTEVELLSSQGVHRIAGDGTESTYCVEEISSSQGVHMITIYGLQRSWHCAGVSIVHRGTIVEPGSLLHIGLKSREKPIHGAIGEL